MFAYRVNKSPIFLFSALFFVCAPLFAGQDLAFRRAKIGAATGEYGRIYVGNVGVIVTSDYDEMSRTAAEMLMNSIRRVAQEKGEVKLGLPTGNTPRKMYEILRTEYKDDPVWAQVILIQLDEYVGASPDSPESFQYQLREALANQVRLKRFIGINGAAEDIFKERARYEEELTKLGELDILVLGIGANGHLAFNEPGYATDNRVGIVRLTSQTREANHAGFDSALTIALKTILSASEIIVIASGKGKRGIIEEALLGKISLRVPASFLQHHLRTTYVIDEAAASPALKKNP